MLAGKNLDPSIAVSEETLPSVIFDGGPWLGVANKRVELKNIPIFLETLALVVLFCLSNQATHEVTKVCQDSGKP